MLIFVAYGVITMPRCGEVKYKSFKTKWVCHIYKTTKWKLIPEFYTFWLPNYPNCPFWFHVRLFNRLYVFKAIHVFEFDYDKCDTRTVSQIVADKLERQGYRKSDPDYYRLYGILKSLLKEVGHD